MLTSYEYTPLGGELKKGDGVKRTAYSSSVFLTLDGMPIKATCLKFKGEDYFKLRDITDALDCRIQNDTVSKMIWIVPSVPAYDDPSEPVG